MDATEHSAAERAGPMQRLPSGDILVSAGSRYWFLPSWDAANFFLRDTTRGWTKRLTMPDPHATQDRAAKVDITFTVDTRPFEKALRKARRQLWWYSVRRRVRRFFHA